MKARSGHENAKKPAPEQFLVWQLGSRSCYSQQWQGPTARIDPVTAIVFNSRAKGARFRNRPAAGSERPAEWGVW